MLITSVNVRKVEKEGSHMKGLASVLIDDAFAGVDKKTSADFIASRGEYFCARLYIYCFHNSNLLVI